MPSESSSKVRRRLTVGAVVIVLVVAGALVVRNRSFLRPLPKRLATVEAGVLYRSGQPTQRQIENLIEKHGIRTIMILRKSASRRVPDEVALGRSLGLNMIRLPIESAGTVPDEDAAEFFRCLDDPSNRPVLVHCSAGRHRTGYLCALYRVERQGWSVDDAIEEMLSFGFSTERHGNVLEQLQAYVPVRDRVPATQPTALVRPIVEGVP